MPSARAAWLRSFSLLVLVTEGHSLASTIADLGFFFLFGVGWAGKIIPLFACPSADDVEVWQEGDHSLMLLEMT